MTLNELEQANMYYDLNCLLVSLRPKTSLCCASLPSSYFDLCRARWPLKLSDYISSISSRRYRISCHLPKIFLRFISWLLVHIYTIRHCQLINF